VSISDGKDEAMNPNDVLTEVVFKLFIILMVTIAALSLLDAVLQTAILINR
jgi:hypothetical protein